MSDFEAVLLTSFLTVLGGVFVFSATKVLNIAIIKPYMLYRGLVGEISEELLFYADVYSNPGIQKGDTELKLATYREASKRFRRLASRLSSVHSQLVVSGTKKIISREELPEVVSCLIRISNALYDSEQVDPIIDARDKIREILKINS